MTNQQKIQKLLQTGFGVLLHDKAKKECRYLYTIHNNQYIYIYITNDIFIREIEKIPKEINTFNFEITPIPHLHKEIKGKVDILDLPELREIANNWDKEKKEMIGQKGLEIKRYCNDYQGQSYDIYTKDKTDNHLFPAWCVVPYMEEEFDEEEAIRLLEERGRIKDGKILN